MTNKTTKPILIAMLTMILALSAVATTIPYAEAKNSNPTVLPPTSKQYDKHIEKWWQWAVSIPRDNNPVYDENGEFCDVDQSGNVWFLAGTTGGTVDRECSIPAGKQILFPIVNGMFSEVGAEAAEAGEGELVGLFDLVEDLITIDVVIDGVELSDEETYRFQNLNAFEIDCQPDVSELCAPSDSTHEIYDGFYIMLTPLTPGEHTIEFVGTIPDFGFQTGATYNITVE